jgi:hypothetical protein
MRAQIFRAIRIMEIATRFNVKTVELSTTCMKRLRAHPRHFTRASQLASLNAALQIAYVKITYCCFPFRRILTAHAQISLQVQFSTVTQQAHIGSTLFHLYRRVTAI